MKNCSSISIIMPTFNSGATIWKALESIRIQDYPHSLMELIAPDAGSTDDTLDALCNFKARTGYRVFRLDNRRLKTAEAGRALAIDYARNDILAFIDSDNVLPQADWLRRMVEPFSDPGITMTEPSEYTRRDCDGPINRYLAMMGMADPLNFWLNTHDRRCVLSDLPPWSTWSAGYEDRGGYLKIPLSKDHIPTIGANGYLVRRAAVLLTRYKPYQFDVETTHELVELGYNTIAKVNVGIVHLVARSWRIFYRKQRRRARDYYFYQDAGLRRRILSGNPLVAARRFILDTLLVLPLVLQAWRGYYFTCDRAWACHIPACWLTLLAYGWTVARRWVTGWTEKPERGRWGQ